MVTRDQLNQEKLDRLLRLLEQKESLTQFNEIRGAGTPDDVQTVSIQRQKSVDQIKTDFQTARGNYDTAVTDYQNATNTSEEFSAVVAAVDAQQAQIDEIVEFLVLTSDSL